MPETPSESHDGISVIVPAYKTPGTLPTLCEELLRHVAPLVDNMELVIVDDGSPDGTWNDIEAVARCYDWVRGIRLLRNFGQHNALLAGMRSARYPLILTIDDDLQNPPAEVSKLYEALTDQIDLVYGTPIEEPQSLGRNAASVGTKRVMARLLGPSVYPKASAFRLFRRILLDGASELQDPFLSIDVMLSWSTTRITAVDVHFKPRAGGKSGYNFTRLLRHTFNMVTGYSTRPLRIVSAMGVFIAGLGFGLLAYVLVTWAIGATEVRGFTFLAAAITLFSGVQLLSLGVVGEYLGRIHFRTLGKPPYVVRMTTGSDDHGSAPPDNEAR